MRELDQEGSKKPRLLDHGAPRIDFQTMQYSWDLLFSSYSAFALLNMVLLLTQKFWLKASTRSRLSLKIRSSSDSFLGTGYRTGRKFDTGWGVPTRNLSAFVAGSKLSRFLEVVVAVVDAVVDAAAEEYLRLIPVIDLVEVYACGEIGQYRNHKHTGMLQQGDLLTFTLSAFMAVR